MKENIKKGDNKYSLDRSSSIYTDSGIETRRERNFDEQIRITIKKKTKKNNTHFILLRDVRVQRW